MKGLAAFDATTGAYLNIAPDLPGTGPEVRDFDVYGSDLVVAGKFTSSSTQKNLMRLNPITGQVTKWYNAPALWTTLSAPDLNRIYGAADSLLAFDATTGKKLWTRAATTYVSPPGHNYPPRHADLLRDPDGSIWSACICDSVGGAPAKAIVHLDTEGGRLPFPVDAVTLDQNAIGYAVVTDGVDLYLAAGGSDAVWKLTKAGAKVWRRDVSGSAQTATIADGQLVIGGHFLEVADTVGDTCGFRSSNPATLDPNNECARRDGLAAYSFDGALNPDFNPTLSGKYNLAWIVYPSPTDTTKLHVGGEWTKVNGLTQNHFARLGL